MQSESLRRSSTPSYLSFFQQTDAAFLYLLTLLFFCLTLWGILHHEMWRDELQAWLVARDSASLVDLVHNVRYERTPALWHACLYGLSHLTHNPIAMQLFHLAIATASVYLFVKYSPFTKLQKVMFSFGYLPFYEYAVISRSYALGVLLVFITCVLLTRPARNYFAVALTLGLLANTNIYGLMIASAFALAVSVELLTKYGSLGKPPSKKVMAGAFLLLFALVLLSVSQLIPSSEHPVIGAFPMQDETYKNRLLRTLLQVFGSHFTIPNIFDYHFWDTNILQVAPEAVYRRVGALISLVLLASGLTFFLRKPIVLLLYVSGTGAIIWFSFAQFPGHIRHNGHLFILLIACLWLAEFYDASGVFKSKLKSFDQFLPRYCGAFLNALLFISLVGGVFAMSMDLRYPFSETRKVAEFIEGHITDGAVLVGNDFMVSPMTAYLNRRCYMLESGTFGTFVIWDNKRETKDDNGTLQTLGELLNSGTQELLFVSRSRLDRGAPDLEISELAEFTKSLNGDTFYVYRVRKPGG